MHPKVRVGLAVTPSPPMWALRSQVALARVARADALFVPDHLQGLLPASLWTPEATWAARWLANPHEIFDFATVLGAIARSAGPMRLGIGVTDPARRHPAVLAQTALTLAHLGRRAPILGMGTGERENTEPYGVADARPVGRLEEALQILRLALTSTGPFDFDGEHFQLHGAVVGLRPPPGRTPEIWVGGYGPRMLRLTGTYADGWLPSIIGSAEEYATKLAAVRAAASDAGRDPARITPAYIPLVAVAPTRQAARAMLESDIFRFLGLLVPARSWPDGGASHPFGRDFRGGDALVPEQLEPHALREALPAVPPEVPAMAVMTGTPDELLARLRELAEAGMEHVSPIFMSALFGPRAALFTNRAYVGLARRLRTGE